MSAAFKNGAPVRQRVKPIEGIVDGRRFNESHDCMEYHVGFTADDGSQSAKWFLEGQLEAIPEPEKTEGDAPAAPEGEQQ